MWKYEFIILWQPSVMVHNAGAYTFHFGIFLNIKLSTDDDLNICVYWAHGNKVYCKGGAIISVTSSFWRTNRYFLRVLYMVLYWVSSYYTTQLIVTHRSWVYTMASSSYIAIASFFFADTFSWVSSAAVLLKDVDDDNNDSWSASSEQRKNVSQTGSSNRATRRIFLTRSQD